MWCSRFSGVPTLAQGRWGHQRGGKGVAVLKWGTHKSPPAPPHLSPIFTGEAAALFWQLLAGKYWLKPKTRRLTHGVLTNTGRGPWRVWGAASPGDRGTLKQGGDNLSSNLGVSRASLRRQAARWKDLEDGEKTGTSFGVPLPPPSTAQGNPAWFKGSEEHETEGGPSPASPHQQDCPPSAHGHPLRVTQGGCVTHPPPQCPPHPALPVVTQGTGCSHSAPQPLPASPPLSASPRPSPLLLCTALTLFFAPEHCLFLFFFFSFLFSF